MSVFQTDVLRRILSAAQSGARRYASHAQSTSVIPNELSINDLHLPTPEPLTAQLVVIGVDEPSAERIASAVMRVVGLFKDNLEADHQRRCHSLREQAQCLQDSKFRTLLASNYHAVFLKAVQSWTTYVLEDFTPRLLKARSFNHWGIGSQKNRRPFNQGAIPVLEQFFERNAFPSRLEKFELASQCDMTYRQIDVWFQNHRTRFKKEGKQLPRQAYRGVLVEELEISVVDALLPDGTHGEDVINLTDHCDPPSSAVASLCDRSQQSVFYLESPAHAFPSPYPPLCAYDPFPMTPEKRKLQLPWVRCARQSPLPTRDVIADLNELAAAFSRLTIMDDSSADQVYSPRSRTCSHLQAHPLGFVTPCSRAPHPALIRRSKRGARSTCSSGSVSYGDRTLSVLRAKPSSSAPIGSAVPLSRPLLTPASPSLHRKKRTLPRRVPKHAPLPQVAAMLVPPPRAQSSIDPPSRTTSISSSRSSLGSYTSDVESPLTTPKLLPLTPPIDDIALISSSMGSKSASVKQLTQTDSTDFAPLIDTWTTASEFLAPLVDFDGFSRYEVSSRFIR